MFPDGKPLFFKLEPYSTLVDNCQAHNRCK